jgi:hypothetical protein
VVFHKALDEGRARISVMTRDRSIVLIAGIAGEIAVFLGNDRMVEARTPGA